MTPTSDTKPLKFRKFLTVEEIDRIDVKPPEAIQEALKAKKAAKRFRKVEYMLSLFYVCVVIFGLVMVIGVSC